MLYSSYLNIYLRKFTEDSEIFGVITVDLVR